MSRLIDEEPRYERENYQVHINSKAYIALGSFASPNAKDSTFALPNAKNTNMLVSLALGDALGMYITCYLCRFH